MAELFQFNLLDVVELFGIYNYSAGVNNHLQGFKIRDQKEEIKFFQTTQSVELEISQPLYSLVLSDSFYLIPGSNLYFIFWMIPLLFFAVKI